MIRQEIKIDRNLSKIFENEIKNAAKNIATVTAAQISRHFIRMLYYTPQYSGNFVANMHITYGTRATKAGEHYYKKGYDANPIFHQGATTAIAKALENNTGFTARFVRSAVKAAGWNPVVTVYNRLPEAEEIESLPPNELRPVNQSGFSPMRRFATNLQREFDRELVVGSARWNKLLFEGGL